MENFLLASLLLFTVAAVTIVLSRSIGLGSILGLLIAGIIIGPYTPGPYVTNDVETLRHFAEFGVVLLLFIIGLEMQPKKLWSMRFEVFGLGGLQVGITGVIIGFFLNRFIEPLSLAMILGFTLALSSTAFVMQLLQEKGYVASEHGRKAFAVLLFQDLAIVPLLVLLPIVSSANSLTFSLDALMDIVVIFCVIGMVLIFGRYILPLAFDNVAKQSNQDAFLFITILAVILSAYLMDKVGLSMGLGAFMMGMLLSTSKYRFQIQAGIEPFRGMLMSIFFIAVGMSINVKVLMENPLEIALNIVSIFIIKTVVVFFIAFLSKSPTASAIRMSFLLSQCGEFGFVLFGTAKALNVIDENTFVFGMGVISISMLFTPFVYNLGLKLANIITKSSTLNYIYANEEHKGKIVIAGYGDTGKIIASMLKHIQKEFIAIDNDIEVVKKARKLGENVFYGDVSDDKLLEAIRVEQSQAVIIAVNSGQSAIKSIMHIRQACPHVYIVARSLEIKNMTKMFLSGANEVIAERAEGSLRIGSEVLLTMGIPEDDIMSLLESYRKNEYELIREIE